MNIKTTTVTGILRLASARIERRYEHLETKRETLPLARGYLRHALA